MRDVIAAADLAACKAMLAGGTKSLADALAETCKIKLKEIATVLKVETGHKS